MNARDCFCAHIASWKLCGEQTDESVGSACKPLHERIALPKHCRMLGPLLPTVRRVSDTHCTTAAYNSNKHEGMALQAEQLRKCAYVSAPGQNYDPEKDRSCTIYAGTMVQQVTTTSLLFALYSKYDHSGAKLQLFLPRYSEIVLHIDCVPGMLTCTGVTSAQAHMAAAATSVSHPIVLDSPLGGPACRAGAVKCLAGTICIVCTLISTLGHAQIVRSLIK